MGFTYKLPTDDPFVLWITPREKPYEHGRKSYPVDLRALRDGLSPTKTNRGFKGLPTLAGQILGAAKAHLASKRPHKTTSQNFKMSLHHFWRFADLFTTVLKTFGEPETGIPNFDDLWQIPGSNWKLFQMWLTGFETTRRREIYVDCKLIFEAAAKELSAQEIAAGRPGRSFRLPYCPFPPEREFARWEEEGPYPEEVCRAIVAAATAEFRSVERRFRDGHASADRGEDPIPLRDRQRAARIHSNGPGWEKVWTRANTLHFIRNLGLTDLSWPRLTDTFGIYPGTLKHPPELRPSIWTTAEKSRGRSLADHIRWFYPSASDLIGAIMIVSMRTGWNLETILSMKRSNWWRPHPEDPQGAVVMYSRKARARGPGGPSKGRVQRAMSLRKRAHAFDVVNTVIQWTEPLRIQATAELEDVINQLEGMAPDQPGRASLQRDRERLEDLVDRVWLCMSLNPFGVTALNQQTSFGDEANQILERAGVREGDEFVRWSSRRARDAYICFVYEASGYNLLLTAIQSGHKSLTVLVSYLKRKVLRRRDDAALRDLQSRVFAAVRDGRSISPKALRTRWGTSCSDPREPDAHVEPNHRAGELCRGQNCLQGCSKAFVTGDALPFLARMALMLRERRSATPVPVWETSESRDDLAIIEGILAQFSASLVKKAFTSAAAVPVPDLMFNPSRLIAPRGA
jgi:hypothetical protein